VWTGESRCAAAGARLAPLLARLHHEDAVVTPYSQDEAIWFTRNCPFTPAALQQHVEIWSAVSPGSAVSKEWRRRFAQRALTAWGQGGSVWLAERALRPTPRGNWNWVDGDDPFVRWRQFSEFFGQLDLADTIGGADGFVRVVPTVHTRDVLAESASP